MDSTRRYPLDPDRADATLREVERWVPLGPVEESRRTLTLLDTFDGRLRRDEGLLVAEHGRDGYWLRWVDLDLREERGALEVDTLPRFAWDLPSGPLRARLARRLDLRAVLPLAHVEEHRQLAEVSDEQGRRIAVVEVLRSRLRSTRMREPRVLAPQLMVTPAKGHEAWAARLHRDLARVFPPDPDTRPWADRLVEAAGFVPGAHPGRSHPDLAPTLDVVEGHRRVYAALVHDLEANEAGAKADLDSEFLHDYRVALRRLRACLAFSREWVDPELREFLKSELAWLAGCTGETRDLDVHLIALPALAQRLAGDERNALVRHHRYAAQRQRSAQTRMAAALESARYHRLKRQLREACDQVESPGDGLLGESVGRHLKREFHRVRRTGRGFGPEPTEDQLHELRKRAKRLRALLEVFPGVLTPSQSKPLRRDVRRLLSRLGGLQDVVVHLETVDASARRLEGDAPTLLALGSLLELLREERQRRLRKARKAFARFDRPAVHRRFRRVWRELKSAPEAVGR